jgi:hypothetical protein
MFGFLQLLVQKLIHITAGDFATKPFLDQGSEKRHSVNVRLREHGLRSFNPGDAHGVSLGPFQCLMSKILFTLFFEVVKEREEIEEQTFTSRLSSFSFRPSGTFAFNSTTSCSRLPRRRAGAFSRREVSRF